ncbi:MAG: efflux RND transporter periplasmic adaptor subunit [Kiritimatiellae bacterium]|nr:efflux RND transporter periplasmic adaptor subunit [Kiritimatiellia bacterium]
MSLLLAAEMILPVARVKNLPDNRSKTYPGRVVHIQRVDVIPQVSGEILEVCFRNGADVKAGDILYRLDPVKYKAAVKNAESKMQEMKANVHYAELSYERHKKLLETRAVSLDAVDNALSQRDSSRAAFAAAQAELVAAKDDLAHCTIVAPISGKVGTTAKTKGNYLTAGSGTLVSIVQTDPVRVRFSVSNRELLEFFHAQWSESQENAVIKVRLADGTVFPRDGKAEYMENAADEFTDTMQIFALFDNKEGLLKVGGTVSVTLSSRKGVLRPSIPASSILQDVKGPYVWVVDGSGAVERRYIARGDLHGSGWLYVEKGLKLGERIVAEGGHKVRKDTVIKPVE